MHFKVHAGAVSDPGKSKAQGARVCSPYLQEMRKHVVLAEGRPCADGSPAVIRAPRRGGNNKENLLFKILTSQLRFRGLRILVGFYFYKKMLYFSVLALSSNG